MSTDGSLVATTTFVTGHSYAQASLLHRDDHPARRQVRSATSRRGPPTVDGRPLHRRRPQLLGRHLRLRRRHLLRHGRLGRHDLADEGIAEAQVADLAADRRRVPVALPRRHQGRLQEAARQHDARASGGSPSSIWPPARRPCWPRPRSVDDQVEWLDETTSCTRCRGPGPRPPPPMSGRCPPTAPASPDPHPAGILSGGRPVISPDFKPLAQQQGVTIERTGCRFRVRTDGLAPSATGGIGDRLARSGRCARGHHGARPRG